ncbi:Rne/Rng family ribonuclease, partial [Streptomyces sp. NPDC102365]|uniref:Rne/Rng family ribonuclease n=1 Tax=Streptomyces sp. NPDC102365 TaxID=3366162 RepID=UPI0037F3749B
SQVAEAPAAAVVAEQAPGADADAEAASAPRARRRATRRATAPSGAPQAAEAAEASVTVEASQVAEAPAAAVVAEQAPGADADAEAASAPRARRRATRRATAPAGAPQAEAEGETSEPAPAEAAAEPTRRAARQKAECAKTPTATEPAEAVARDERREAPVAAARNDRSAETETPADAEDATPRRARRRATRKAAGGFSAPAPRRTAEEGSARRPARPAVAVFQAPVFTEPMFQTPERAAAAAAAEAAEEAEEVVEPVQQAAPVTAPVVAAEEETGGSRRRRRRGKAEEPAAPAERAPVERAPEAEEPADEEPVEEESAEDAADGDDSEETGSRRRRRRGGRRRRRGESADADDDFAGEQNEQNERGGRGEQAARTADDTDDTEDAAEQSEEDSADADDDHDDGGGSSSSRRRRRRRRRAGDSSGEVETGDSDPERTVVKVREPRKKDEHPSDEVQSIKGSTRLEAKKQRRREGREQGRRRVPIITEAEFLARREAVERVMVVRQNGERTQIGVLEDDVLVEHYVNKEQATSYVGNVYLGKVQNVLPSMEAAFIDIGKGRNAVLYAGEVNFEALGMANGPRRIESALKSGQSVLVQVTKDPIGHKGARLTSQVSLPGRYLVYVPEGSMTGISRKLPDTERARLKTILKKIVPEDAGVIVRTAAEGASEDELRRDVERLQAQWEDIEKKAKSGGGSNAPTLLYGEPDMTVRVVRDIFNEDFTKVIVSGDEAWDTIHGYVAHVAPDLANRLSRWTSEVDVFATYRIDEQLAKALDRKVWLPSGGSLVIDKTEAMIVVDVNTGKFTGQGGNLEETVTRNNLEAAEEIVRQLRLRDLGGIVVIDFIDMVLESNRDLVLRRLLECLGRDRTKHQVAEVTSLGLVQMTRKRVGQGLLESFSETCVHCNGRGVIVHMEQPTSAGGGGKRKKRGRGGAEQTHEHEHTHDHAHETEPADAVEPDETAAEVAAEAAEPVALPEPEFVPDEDLYSSAAEAEAAATRGGRSRRRSGRRASAPAGAPRSESRRAERAERVERNEQAERAAERGDEVPTAQSVTTEEEIARPVQQEPAEVAQAAPFAAEDPTVEAPAATEAPAVDDAAPKGRTRRRATRKVSAPAGSPAVAEETVVTVSEPVTPAAAPAEPVERAAEAVPAGEQPVADSAAPARPRRRAVRKATAPTSSAETAVVVVPSAQPEAPAQAAEAPVEAPAESSGEDGGDGPDAAAPVKKTARKAAKKAPAKKAAAKKTTTAAKKTAAKKTTAKKATKTAKTAAKSTSKKTAAAEQQTPSTVTASTDED